MVGDSENYCVEYIRETKKREYKWKKNPRQLYQWCHHLAFNLAIYAQPINSYIIILWHRWIFVEYDVRDLKYTKENCRILKRDKQFCPVPITFDQSECQTQIEVIINFLLGLATTYCLPDLVTSACVFFFNVVVVKFALPTQWDKPLDHRADAG